MAGEMDWRAGVRVPSTSKRQIVVGRGRWEMGVGAAIVIERGGEESEE